jgi:hypothetical protein
MNKASDPLLLPRKYLRGGENVSGFGEGHRNVEGIFQGPGSPSHHPDLSSPRRVIRALLGHGSGRTKSRRRDLQGKRAHLRDGEKALRGSKTRAVGLCSDAPGFRVPHYLEHAKILRVLQLLNAVSSFGFRVLSRKGVFGPKLGTRNPKLFLGFDRPVPFGKMAYDLRGGFIEIGRL